jgi:hypothetical protein
MTDLLGQTSLAVAGSIPCIYCRASIPAGTFAYWSSGRRLLSADCPSCQRRMTLTARVWRRWVGLSCEPRSLGVG